MAVDVTDDDLWDARLQINFATPMTARQRESLSHWLRSEADRIERQLDYPMHYAATHIVPAAPPVKADE